MNSKNCIWLFEESHFCYNNFLRSLLIFVFIIKKIKFLKGILRYLYPHTKGYSRKVFEPKTP